MNRVNVVGDSLIDLNFTLPRQFIHRYHQAAKIELPFGEKLSTEGYVLLPGGSGANVVNGLVKAGFRVWFHTGLATDLFGDYLRTFLAQDHIDLDEGQSGEQTSLSVILRAGGERTIVTARAAGSSLPTSLPPDGWIHLGPVHGPIDEFAAMIVNHQVKTSQMLSFNPSVETLEERSRGFLALLRSVTILIVNVHEALVLTRLPHRTSPAALLQTLHRLGPRIVCITDGERGAYLTDGQTRLAASALRTRLDRVDTTGAGDAFTSGLLAGYITKMDDRETPGLLRHALACGIANAAAAVSEVGGPTGLLELADLEQDAERVKLKELE